MAMVRSSFLLDETEDQSLRMTAMHTLAGLLRRPVSFEEGWVRQLKSQYESESADG